MSLIISIKLPKEILTSVLIFFLTAPWKNNCLPLDCTHRWSTEHALNLVLTWGQVTKKITQMALTAFKSILGVGWYKLQGERNAMWVSEEGSLEHCSGQKCSMTKNGPVLPVVCGSIGHKSRNLWTTALISSRSINLYWGLLATKTSRKKL